MPIRTCDAQPLLHVRFCFIESKWVRLRPQSQSLPQLAQLGLPKFVLEFWLANQDDLEQFLGKSLKIRQHPDFLKDFVREVLCFIDDQHRSFSCAVSVKKPVIEP